jgi:hypothetical protein
MKSIREMSQIELAAFVQSHLREKGIEVILSGGASVAFYSGNRFVSMDVDLINAYFAKLQTIESVMSGLGFSEKGRYFIHPDTDFFIDFPAGPLAVGKEPVKEIDEHTLSTGVLRIISPTDCVKDRLLGYFHWGDRQSLEQAVLVASLNSVDLDEIERWANVEGELEAFLAVKERLANFEM